MKYVLSEREPKLACKYFEELAAIPRGSRNELEAAKFVEARAKELGLFVVRNDMHDVYVRKPATPGYEHLPSLLLQAHLDMVCEKNADSAHDFTKDGLDLVLNGDILTANGTTLGADDGKGCAYMLALMDEDSDKFPHPQLEFLFTSCEEVGFFGALAQDYSLISARRMIGLDAGPEDAVSTTSAGAQEVNLFVPVEYEDACGDVLKVSVGGLLGGHSAMCITDEKANANKLMARLLHNASTVADFRLCNIKSGLMFNAIPREAVAVVAVKPEDKDAFVGKINEVYEALKVEYAASDKNLTVTVENAEADKMFTAKLTKTVIDTMYLVYNGVLMMNKLVDGLPVTSTNMGVVKTLEDKVQIVTFTRSSSKTLNDELVEHMTYTAKLCGMTEVKLGDWLAAWPYNPDSKMRALAQRMYKEKHGTEMREIAVHGGLELGLFSERMPGMDIVTLGPDGGDAHTITEWMDIASFERVYNFIKEFIEELTKE